MEQLDLELIKEYNATRNISKKTHLCHAPFNNIYFNIYGQAAPCWLTLQNAPTYPQHNLREIWFGPRYESMRSNIAANNLSGPCHVCERNIKNKVFKSALANAYDNEYPLTQYPSIMEFELSNTCNLECVMCTGMLSSTIRRDRDGLPLVKSPYDSSFVEQLKEFIPHLKEARFNGGEPLLQTICWDIWEEIAKLNPSIEITLATNGTTLNDKAKALLSRCRFRINVSIDSLDPVNYPKIRVNANLDKVLKNVEWYAQYCRLAGTNLAIMVNPMNVNWWEMPEFVKFCSEKQIWLWYNTIWRPRHLALWNLESSKLQTIYDQLARNIDELERNPIPSPTFSSNLEVLRNLVHGQIKTWIREQRERESQGRDRQALERARDGSKKILFNKLKAHFKSDVHTLSLYEEKLQHLEQKVASNVRPADYYHLLNEQPLESVLEDLKAKSPEVLVEWVYRHDGYY